MLFECCYKFIRIYTYVSEYIITPVSYYCCFDDNKNNKNDEDDVLHVERYYYDSNDDVMTFNKHVINNM